MFLLTWWDDFLALGDSCPFLQSVNEQGKTEVG